MADFKKSSLLESLFAYAKTVLETSDKLTSEKFIVAVIDYICDSSKYSELEATEFNKTKDVLVSAIEDRDICAVKQDFIKHIFKKARHIVVIVTKLGCDAF